MKVGIYLTNQHPPGTDMVSALEEQFAMVRAARDRGWDAVATGQHYLSEGMAQLQLVPFLSRLAGEAGGMTGIAGVLLLSLHNPVEVAEHVASLDVIWKGNFAFGVGLGYREIEFDAFRVPRGQRIRRFEECLTLVKRLWTEDAVSFESDVCKLDKVSMTI
ncbi:MAG: LLM class flavin-dependent oxidoreductase, partial [candidate division NC10 bacterium]